MDKLKPKPKPKPRKFYKEMSKCRACSSRFEVISDEGTRYKHRTYCPNCRKKYTSYWDKKEKE